MNYLVRMMIPLRHCGMDDNNSFRAKRSDLSMVKKKRRDEHLHTRGQTLTSLNTAYRFSDRKPD